MANEAVKRDTDSSDRAEVNNYDRGIIPAETAARMEREGDKFKKTPTEEREAEAPTDDQTDSESIRTTDGYTIDNEGLSNNYAIEPEMYYEEPGDARQQAAEEKQQRIEELGEVNQDEEGKLTDKGDSRGRGPGII
ncbi:MAG: hypothetical protein RMY64_08555 [Nostoc sp. DedQUE08]|uniref:hypothetical protein n=1 Tax=unclassified Nostoc TaxID=2593658 RepID=UPI002AD2EE90|nr:MULTISPECIES: hypothetical protein [unclassified Nostoc]MDZ8035693.1 hypothetical protein [Nostoc sp. DedSLP04]MDZ8065678.1 hypothetical protein [Nostoc sp. DedQUE08]MDZ8093117.1 hypothetical protein [Nostoc sp. DedQUE05]MDZ8131033.1 hypothetical protein [Nostoc sp. DedQUE07]MDZ8135685.1 hypothetical protein [Nostoc sp. DedQUE04]